MPGVSGIKWRGPEGFWEKWKEIQAEPMQPEWSRDKQYSPDFDHCRKPKWKAV